MRREVFFNGYRLNDDFEILSIRRDILPPRSLVTQEIPGRAGTYFFDVTRGSRITEIDVLLLEQSYESLWGRLTEIASKLDTDDVADLIITDEPNIVRKVMIDGETALKEILKSGMATLTFYQPDSHKYGLTRHQLIHDPGGDPEANPIIEYNGTAPTFPTFRATVIQPITFLDLISPDDYMRIGWPIDVTDEIPVEREELRMWDDMSSTVGWTTATEIDGVVAGSIESNGTRFQPVSFGTGSGWHGPALKTSIPGGPIQDFRMDAIVGFWNQSPAVVGRVEVYLLDDQNRVVAKIAIKDTRNGSALAWGEARLGDSTVNYHMIDEYGDRPGNWNNFYGMLRLERVGNAWWARIAKIDQTTGRHHTIRSVRWTDEDNVFNRNVAQVVVHFGQYGSNTTGAMGVYDIKVWRINQVLQNEIPYIAMPDDIIEIDHQRNLITKNGEDFLWPKDFGARFFPIHPGLTEIAVQPAEAVKVEVKWGDVYK